MIWVLIFFSLVWVRKKTFVFEQTSYPNVCWWAQPGSSVSRALDLVTERLHVWIGDRKVHVDYFYSYYSMCSPCLFEKTQNQGSNQSPISSIWGQFDHNQIVDYFLGLGSTSSLVVRNKVFGNWIHHVFHYEVRRLISIVSALSFLDLVFWMRYKNSQSLM